MKQLLLQSSFYRSSTQWFFVRYLKCSYCKTVQIQDSVTFLHLSPVVIPRLLKYDYFNPNSSYSWPVPCRSWSNWEDCGMRANSCRMFPSDLWGVWWLLPMACQLPSGWYTVWGYSPTGFLPRVLGLWWLWLWVQVQLLLQHRLPRVLGSLGWLWPYMGWSPSSAFIVSSSPIPWQTLR